MATAEAYWEPPFSRAQGACGKSRAAECDGLSGRRASGLRRAFGCVAAANDGRAFWATPPSATLSDRLGLSVRYVSDPQQWSATMETDTGAETGAQGTWEELLSRVGSAPAKS